MMSSKLASALKPSSTARLGGEIARPTRHDIFDERIGLAADAGGHLLARNLLQGGDLLTDRHRQAGHGERPPGADLVRIEAGGVLKKADGGPR